MADPALQYRQGDLDNDLLRKILGQLQAGTTSDGTTIIRDATDPTRKATVTAGGALVVSLSGGGGGAAVTVADGADVALGTTTDPANTTYSGAGTVVGFLKGAVSQLSTIIANLATLATEATQLTISGLITTIKNTVSGIQTTVNDIDDQINTLVARTPTEGQKVMAGSSPVVIASDQSAVPVSISSGGFDGNVSKWNGNIVDTNSGSKTAGTLRVVLATDQPSLSNALPVSQSGTWNVGNTTGTATTSALTGTGSATATSLGAFPTVLVSIHGTYGISTAVFEASDDAGATWYGVQGVRSDAQIIEGGFTSIAANTSRMWTIPINGANQFRVRVTTMPSGTLNVSITPSTGTTADSATVAVTPSQGTLTDRSGTMSSGGVAQTVANANTARKYFIFVNDSTETMWINFTTTAVQNQPSIPVLPNGSFVMESGYVSTEAVSVISATTGSAFTAKEG